VIRVTGGRRIIGLPVNIHSRSCAALPVCCARPRL
jgi:hypothetical protein